jgi:hypothetical protein
VSLSALEVEQLDGDGLRSQPRLEVVVDVSLVNGAESALADEVGHGEVPGDGLQVGDGENVQVGPRQRQRQVLRRHHPAQLREGHPALQPPPRRRRRRRHLLLLLALLLLPAFPGGGGGGVGGGGEAPEQSGPLRPRHASLRVCVFYRSHRPRFGRTRRGIYKSCDAIDGCLLLAGWVNRLIACQLSEEWLAGD